MQLRAKATRSAWMVIAAIVCSTTSLCGIATRTHAQQTPEQQQLLQEALTEYDAGRWNEAYLLFKRLHEQDPSARTLRGMGLTAFESSRYATAIVDLQHALTETRRALKPQQRREVEDFLKRANQFVGRFELTLRPSTLMFTVDGREPLLDQASVLLLDPGAHEIVASALDHQTLMRTLTVEAGDRRSLILELEGSVAAASSAPQAQATATPTPMQTRALQDAASANDVTTTEGESGSAWPYITAASTLVFVGAAVGLHLAARGAADDVEAACRNDQCDRARASTEIDHAHLRAYQNLSFIGWGLAGASAIATVVLWSSGSGDEHAADAPAVALLIGPTSLGVRGAF